MNGTPEHGGKEPGLAGGLGWILLLVICCAGVPLLLTAGVLPGGGGLADLEVQVGPACWPGCSRTHGWPYSGA